MVFSTQPRARIILRLAFLGLLVAVALYFLFFSQWRPRNLDDVKEQILAFGPAAPFVTVVLQAVAVVFLIPGFLLVLATSILFGPDSIWISILGQTLGASACFFIARFVGEDTLKNLLGQRIVGIEKILQEHAFRYLLTLRFFAVIPLPLVAYGPGLVNMRYWQFLIATLLGEMPFIIVVGLFGHSLSGVRRASDLWEPQFVLPAALLVGLLTIPLTTAYLLRRRQIAKRRKASAATPPPAANKN